MNLSVVPLHNNRQYLDECCKLINDEWKRSETARLRSLESSSDKLPTSLILVQNNEKVIGHVKLSPIPSLKDSCFIETVVIEKNLRGKGYGTILMNKAEEYCINCLQLKSIYLSTRGQEMFYTKLGYTVCSPISIYGSCTINNVIQTMCMGNKQENGENNHFNTPIPPPMPTVKIRSESNKTYMKKDLF